MNRTSLNAATLGSGGGSSAYVWLSATRNAVATSTANFTRYAMLQSSTFARATSVAVFAGIFAAASDTVARATSTATAMVAYAQYVYASTIGTSDAVLAASVWIMNSAAFWGESLLTLVTTFWSAVVGNTTAAATTSITVTSRNALSFATASTACACSTVLNGFTEFAASSTAARATGSIAVGLLIGSRAADDRQMVVPEEPRGMEVTP